MKSMCTAKDIIKKKDNPQSRRKHLQIMCVTQDLNLEVLLQLSNKKINNSVEK